MKELWIIALLTLLTSCSPATSISPEVRSFLNRYEKNIYETEKTEVRLKEYGSIGRYNPEVNEIGIMLSCEEKMSMEEARIKFVRVVEDLLVKINTAPEMSDVLYEYPFTAQHLAIEIKFFQGEGDDEIYVEPPFIAAVSLVDGMIYYSVRDSKLQLLDFVWEEPYEEALRQSLRT